MSWTFRPVAGSPFSGELDGPVWDGGALLFANVAKSEILRYDPASDRVAVFRPGAVRTRGLAFARDGRLYGAQTRARRIVWYRDDGASFYVESTIDGMRRNDPQHLAIDRAGRIWSTDLWTDESAGGPVGYPALGHCSVLRQGPVGTNGNATWTLSRMTRDTIAPRGIALSADERTLYVTDAGEGSAALRSYAIGEDGSLGPSAVLRRYAAGDGRPAGICIDDAGQVVVTVGGRIEVVDASGKVVETHDVPGGAPTACAFGDAGLDTLFVTTVSGDLLRIAGAGIRGVPTGGQRKGERHG